jgi:ABC-type polysaccharide/polyol phosphate transport system ATPase subunit
LEQAVNKSEYIVHCQSVTVEYLLSSHRHSGLKDFILNRSLYLAGRKKFRALNNVSLQIPRGQSVALIGHNGCGKSTLLKTIAGVITPQAGQVFVTGRVGPMIELGAGFDHELSGRENIELSCMLMGLSRREIKARTPAIIEFADLGEFIDAPLKNYSSGMIARIGFACATAIDPDLLLVDEVLSVGDANFALKCLNRINTLKASGTTVILVSHDMAAVRSFCERALVLEEGNLIFDGNVSEAISFHLDTMHERLSKALPTSDRAEADRQHALRKSNVLSQGPRGQVDLALIQSGCPVNHLDCAKPFLIDIKIKFDRHEQIEDGLAIGLAFTENGQVITGFNNLDLKFLDPAAIARSKGNLHAQYYFSAGLPEFAARREVDIMCGIHDQNIRRELFFGKVTSIEITNSTLGKNLHHYIVDVSPRVNEFRLL